MKTARLIDRFINESNKLIIRVEMNGKYFDVYVHSIDGNEASGIRGNGDVHFEYRGGRAFYVNDSAWYSDEN